MVEPAASVPARAEIVVVGGGVTGASIAYHLAKLGRRDVVLLERRQLTAGTTWHAAGLITSAGMVDESLLWMSRYSRDLYARLEDETGLATGFRAVGHLHLATTPGRLETLRREAAFARGLGVPNEELSPREFAELWPEARADDVLAAFYVPDEGRANPADVTMSLARGARTGGVRIVEGVGAEGFEVSGGRVRAVLTTTGERIECEQVVIACGMWSRQVGALAGVSIPLQAAEHYYLITEEVPWAHRDLPVLEDPDRYGYYREEVGGLLVGLFEPVAAPWSLDRIPDEVAFASLPPDWERTAPFLEAALDRLPGLREVGIRTYFCGPESFTADVHPLLGPAPELDGCFVAAGLNSLGILLGGGVGSVVAQWLVDGYAPLDVAGLSVERAMPHEATRRFRTERTIEQLGVLFGDGVWPNWHPTTARDVRRSVLHDRLAAYGASFSVSSGYEYPGFFAAEPRTRPPTLTHGWQRDESAESVRLEHLAVREAAGVLDMSLMAKFVVEGPDALALCNRVSANQVDVEVGRIVYTQWCNEAGGIEADLTVTRLAEDRFLVVASDVIHRRVAAWLRRHRAPGEVAVVTDCSSATTLLSLQGPCSRAILEAASGGAAGELSNDAFPYLSCAAIEVGAAPVLALRVTYLGELGYELHVPSDLALTAYDALMAAGEPFGLRNVGLLAMNSLRLEKGYRDFGLDIDNTDTPIDAGLSFAVAFDKPTGFVGQQALRTQRESGVQPRRLAQVLLEDPEPLLFGYEPVLLDGEWVGYVRVGAFGHSLGASVGLAMIESRDGGHLAPSVVNDSSFEVQIGNERFPARASLRPLYDPDRTRILA